MLVGLTLAALAFSLAASGALRPADPGLVCDRPVHDFGPVDVHRAGELRHAFTIANPGARPVRVIKVRTTCGCTAADLGQTLIPARGSLEVPVLADWTAKVGPTEQTIVLETDSTVSARLLLSLKGTVTRPVTLSPAFVHLGSLPAGTAADRIVRLAAGSAARPVAITNVSVSSPDVRVVRANDRDEPDESLPIPGSLGAFAVRVTAPPAEDLQRRDASVTFHTDHPDTPTLVLALDFQVQPPLQVRPRSLLFSPPADGPAESQVLEVRTASLDEPPAAQIDWQGTGPSPFRVRGPLPDANRKDLFRFQVDFVPGDDTPPLCQARLCLKGGSHVRPISITAMHAKGHPPAAHPEEPRS